MAAATTAAVAGGQRYAPPAAQWASAAAMSPLIPPASSGMVHDGQFHRCRRWRNKVVNTVAPDAAAHRAASPVNRSSWRRTGSLVTRLILPPARPAKAGRSPGETAASCAHGRTWWSGAAGRDDVTPPHPATPRTSTANAAAAARILADALTLPANCIPGRAASGRLGMPPVAPGAAGAGGNRLHRCPAVPRSCRSTTPRRPREPIRGWWPAPGPVPVSR